MSLFSTNLNAQGKECSSLSLNGNTLSTYSLWLSVIFLFYGQGCGHEQRFLAAMAKSSARNYRKRMAGHTWLFSPSWEVRPVIPAAVAHGYT
ncbi:hypothetical protein AVEN_24916-1 [Araneus ventricosus]|uniref:Uncharacterized protein n=1 Tax=Araneus ventricosus TaxID=182803 RepID=A0A4Y2WK32_ARAVE|nr:hypothetical protein AVEN_24916-1 [Araneus ventricosus]